MTSSLLKDLLRRRVPPILGLYLAAGWGVLEFIDWLISRYSLTPRLADLGLAAWATMIPTVLILAYYHGASGGQGWRRIEGVGISLNLLATAAVLALLGMRAPADEFRAGIEAESGTAAKPTRIAVLYFDDESERQDQGHLAGAFTGALIDELSQVQVLDVAPRGAVRPYRATPVELDSIVRALDVGTLVEGSVSGSSESVLVSVTLIDAATQSVIESFRLEGAVADWSDLRGELAQRVARTLRRRLGVEVRLRERQARTASRDALALVAEAERLRAEAVQLWSAGDSAGPARELIRADSLLAQAEALDPAWVEPIVSRGWVARDRASLSAIAPGTLVQEQVLTGLYHAERALALDPDNAGALELRGDLRFRISQSPRLPSPGWLRQAAERDLRAAVAADPLRPRAWATLSDLHQASAQFAEAKRDAERALEADPFLAEASLVIWRLYETSQELEQMDEAVRWCEEGHRRFPEESSFFACYLFMMSLSQGPEPDVPAAWALQDTFLQLSSPRQRGQLRPVTQAWVAAALARAGLADSAVAVAEHARAAADDELKPWLDYYVANVRLLLGQREAALDLLARFLEAIPQQREYIASDWMFRDLWNDPRFQMLVGKSE